MPRRARASGSEVLIHITAEERDLLLSHVAPPDALDEVLGPYHRHGPLVPLYLTGQQADTFLQLVEEIANSAQNQVAQRRLGVLFERLEDGFADKVDPGAHLVRPAACRAGYTPRQGQYLAFIYHYQALHRRAPAEADLQAFFRASPPAVHAIVVALTRRKFIARTPGGARSIRLLLRPEQIPALE